MHFTKLFSSILDSTIWREPSPVKIVWVTMLAMCDRRGEIHASLPGLADRARVTMEECQDALRRFMSPDKYSRTKAYDGRRIEEIDGGWRLLNHEKYRALLSAEERREYNRRKQSEHRKKTKAVKDPSASVSNCQTPSAVSAHTEADAESEVDAEARKSADAELDIGSPSSIEPGKPVSDSDHWQMHEKNQPWAKQLKAASCKIGRDNWTAWKALVDEFSLPAVLSAARGVPATERWPDRVETTLRASRGQENPGDVVAHKIQRITL